MLGLLLAAGAGLWVGVPVASAQFSTGSRGGGSPSLSDKDRDRPPAPDAPETDSGGRHYVDDIVEIAGVKEQKPDADGRRKVTVRLRYALVHYAEGTLSLGFNLKSATTFTRVTNLPVKAGTGETEISASIVPVTWPDDHPFKVYVSLSAEPHPKQWSLLADDSQVMKPAAAPVSAKGGEAK